MDKITSKETSSGYSRLNDEIIIRYNFESREQKPIERVSGTIYKDELIAGYFNTIISGESGLTFTAGNKLTAEEKQQISARIYSDEYDMFNESAIVEE